MTTTRSRHRRTLRGTLVLAFGAGAAVVALATSAVLVLAVRPVLYESRQNALLREFEGDVSTLYRSLSTEQPTETWEYYAQAFPGRAAIVDLDTGRTAGEVPGGHVPDQLLSGWRDEPGRTRYLRTPVAGEDLFFVASTRDGLDSDPGGAVAVVTAFSLAPEARQVRQLVLTGAGVGGAAVLVAVPAGLLLGSRLTRPLRRLRTAATRLGASRTPAPAPSGFADVDDVTDALTSSSARLATTIDELARREGHARRLVSDVAHELRTPLTSMVAVTEILEDLDGATPDERRTAVAVTRRGTDRLTALVEDLLEMSRLDAGVATARVTTADLRAVVASAVALADPDGTVHVDVAPGTALTSDVDRVRTVVSNLVTNALRHGRPPVRVRAGATDGEVTVDVRDDGPGIPGEARERVFERFAVLDGSRGAGGSGLGLAIARDTAHLLGGDVVVVPAARGAHLRLTLPARPPRGAAPTAPDPR